MKLLKHSSFLLALLCLALTQRSLAVGGVDATPSPAPAHEISFTQPKEGKLDNGLRVIVAERPSLPLLATELIVRTGSEKDPNDRAGTASLTGSLPSDLGWAENTLYQFNSPEGGIWTVVLIRDSAP